MDSTRETLIDELVEKRNGKYFRNTGWIQCRCPNCDENSKDPKDRHLSIYITDNKPLTYHCFRAGCLIRGRVDRKFGRKLGLSPKLLPRIEKLYQKYNRTSVVEKYIGRTFKDYDLGDISVEASDYFFRRTGIEIDKTTQSIYRISSSMENFVRYNNINPERVFSLLYWERQGANFIYFFNDTFSTVNYREIDGKNRKGRVNIIKPDNGQRLLHKPYMLTTTGSKISPEIDQLIVAEGIFDIINVHTLIKRSNVEATLIGCAGIANMRRQVREFSKYHYKPALVVFSDNDVNLEWFTSRLMYGIEDRLSQVNIVFNELAHDWGEIDKIKIDKMKLVHVKLLDKRVIEKLEKENTTP